MVFTPAELEYLSGQRLGRLATAGAGGRLQNNPVGFRVNAAEGTVATCGRDLGRTRKFRNVVANGKAALVVDDILSVSPWRVRCVEVRGDAVGVTDVEHPLPGMSRKAILIRPRRVISFGLGPDGERSSRAIQG